jgi:orotate phosphoribosyltransferase
VPSFLDTVTTRRGHFRMESGYHTDSWMDLETLCLHPNTIQPFAIQLADRLRGYRVDAVCGALNEGAFVSLLVACALDCDFFYTERFADSAAAELFPVRYRLPRPLRVVAPGRRVAVVNDVISAGSAVRGTIDDLRSLGANVVVVGSLLAIGDTFTAYAREHAMPLEALSHTDGTVWRPDECPLCRAGDRAVEDPTRSG